MNTLLDTLQYFVLITIELIALFLFISALVEIVLMYIPADKIQKYLSGKGLLGNALGAAIYGYMPEDFVLKIAGPDNPFAVPVAAVLGVPLYIRAETAIPIGIALMGKGMSIGAVIALIIGGAGMAIPEMSMLASIFKKRLVAMIVATIFLTAVIGGYLFNILL